MDKIITLLAFADVLLALTIALVRPSGRLRKRSDRRLLQTLLRLLRLSKRRK